MHPLLRELSCNSPPHCVCMCALFVLFQRLFLYLIMQNAFRHQEVNYMTICWLTVRHRNRGRRLGCLRVWTKWRPPPYSYAYRRRKWAPQSRCGPGQSFGTTWGWGPHSAPGCNWPGCTHRTERTSAAPAHPAAPDTSGSPPTNLCSHPLQEDKGQDRCQHSTGLLLR